MSHGLQYSTEEIIQALDKTRGGVYLAAELIGCSHKTIERRARDVKAVQEIIDKYRGRRADVAELKLDSAITNGEEWAVKFELTMTPEGKARGYAPRQEVTGKDGEAVVIKVLKGVSMDDL